MKFVSEFRDRETAKGLVDAIHKEVCSDERYRFMEVCGSHTMAISKFGIRSLLPDNVELVSGPGCPVCVTPQWEIDAVFRMAEEAVIVTFGDMLRVPGSNGESLQKLRSEGKDIRIVFSPLDTLAMAVKEPERDFVFLGIGFETTAPTSAALAKSARMKGVENLYITPYSKTVPEVLQVLLDDESLGINGFVCPGHVSVITGLSIYEPVAERGIGAVVTGFEPLDILSSVLELIRQTNSGSASVVNMYPRVVRPEGNPKALGLLDEVFRKEDTDWRGLGSIPGSGLRFNDEYSSFDALRYFEIESSGVYDIDVCRCGDVLKGKMSPKECPLFGDACTPVNPVGPCMVSSEGSCSAYYKYER
ncbi:hydrogenase formation protein HypD [Limisalsivibrio acetivorans]|uniref:hydrogenase formation protein HypD n=1 Tax=Limisalsivibrio acetivorans TaxID=1304888 RepID=UPI0003B79281|nr:hydrogenase formation protein HypD [Limisalsivibrio acetivorans]